MTYPTLPVSTTHLDANTDDPSQARADLKDAVDKLNQIISHGQKFGSRVKGLEGKVNAATPLKKFDLSVDEVILRDAAGSSVVRNLTGVVTCDLNLLGPAANGRDQAAAFSANSSVNIFFIWNDTTLATIASIAAHTGSPVLPSGYTYYAYCTTLPLDASGNIIPVVAMGRKLIYDRIHLAVENLLLNGGTASASTPGTVSYASQVPSCAITAIMAILLSADYNSTSIDSIAVRPKGGAAQWLYKASSVCISTTTQRLYAEREVHLPILNGLRELEYFVSTPLLSGGGYIGTIGYVVPNGDS